MKSKFYGMIVLALLMATTCLAADETGFKSIGKINSFCELALSNIISGKVHEAFQLMVNEWPSTDPSEMQSFEEQTIQQLDIVKSRFGDPLGFEFVKKEEVKNLCLRLTYVIKYERHITRWLFIFYKPQDKWIFNSFNWDDSIKDLF